MGDRALVQLIGKDLEPSPVLYLHWDGSDVPRILAKLKARMQRLPRVDVEYSFARLVQIALDGDEGSTGCGVWNSKGILTTDQSQGDAGVFVVDVGTWVVYHGAGYDPEYVPGLEFDTLCNTEA